MIVIIFWHYLFNKNKTNVNEIHPFYQIMKNLGKYLHTKI